MFLEMSEIFEMSEIMSQFSNINFIVKYTNMLKN